MSETRKLYYEDVYTKEFTANVLNAEKVKRIRDHFGPDRFFIRRAADSHVTLVR